MPLAFYKPVRAPSALRSFTLVEMLVSIAVFSLIVLLLAQTTQMVGTAWQASESRVDNFTRARALLDVAAQDIEHGVFRPDLPAFSTSSGTTTNYLGMTALTNYGTGTNAFYTCRPGTGSGARDVSLVVYALNVSGTSAVLQRADYPIPWSSGNWANYFAFQSNLSSSLNSLSSSYPGNFYSAANGVVDFEFLFQRADGSTTNSYPGYSTLPVTAIGIGLAVIDEQTMKTLSAAQLIQLHSDLSGAFSGNPGTTTIKALWDAKLNSPNYYANYPKPMGKGLKTFERYVTCEPGF